MAAANKKQERISAVRFVHYFSDKHPHGTLAVSGENFKGTFCRLIPCKIDAEGKNTGTIITISYTWRQGILFYEENFLVKNTYSACNTLYCLWEKKGAGTLRRIFDVESFECLKHQSARTDKRVITTAAATTIGYR